jgi:hypothetical protein
MRIWSLHPKYLDAKGLVALWRETLLAKHVLEGKTKGYRNHPQLVRFNSLPDPLNAIHLYLQEVFLEAERRGYHFDKSKIGAYKKMKKIPVTDGQLSYEWKHLKKKLAERAPELNRKYRLEKEVEPHALFEVLPGKVATWEIVSNRKS